MMRWCVYGSERFGTAYNTASLNTAFYTCFDGSKECISNYRKMKMNGQFSMKFMHFCLDIT